MHALYCLTEEEPGVSLPLYTHTFYKFIKGANFFVEIFWSKAQQPKIYIMDTEKVNMISQTNNKRTTFG